MIVVHETVKGGERKIFQIELFVTNQRRRLQIRGNELFFVSDLWISA